MVRETPQQKRSRLADAYRRSLEELSAAVDAHELGLRSAAAVHDIQVTVDRRGEAWWEAVGIEWRVAT